MKPAPSEEDELDGLGRPLLPLVPIDKEATR